MLCASMLRHCTRTFVYGVMARALRDYLNPDVAWQGIAPTPAAVAERPLKVPWHHAARCDSRLAGPMTARLLVCLRASQHRCFSVAAAGLHWMCISAFCVQRCCTCTWAHESTLGALSGRLRKIMAERSQDAVLLLLSRSRNSAAWKLRMLFGLPSARTLPWSPNSPYTPLRERRGASSTYGSKAF